MKNRVIIRLLAVAITAAVAVSTAALPTFAATPAAVSSAALRQEASTNDVTYTLDVTGETGTIHMDGSDADKVINIEQGSRLLITLPSNVGANVGNSAIGTVNPMNKVASGYALNITPWGTVGSKTGMFFRGTKLFTICTAAPTGGWKDDAAPVVHLKASGSTYAFSVTAPADCSLGINTGNGAVGTIDRLKQDGSYLSDTKNSDGTVTHYFSSRARWNSCTFGVYIHVNGKQYNIFRCTIDGSQTPSNMYASSTYTRKSLYGEHGARYGTENDDQFNKTRVMAQQWLDSHQSAIAARMQILKEDEEDTPGCMMTNHGLPYTPESVRLIAIKEVAMGDFCNAADYTDGNAYRVFSTKNLGGCFDGALFCQALYNVAGYESKLAWGTLWGNSHITWAVKLDGKWYYNFGKYVTDVGKAFDSDSAVEGQGYNSD